MMGSVAQMESIFEGVGIERPRLGKSLDIVNEMAQSRISRGLESFNYIQLAKIKAKFERLGGTFANSADTINNIDQSLANPSNPFQEAENYRIYAQQAGSGASYFGFKEWQEQGIGAKGLMKGRMARIKEIFGDSGMAKLAMKNLVKSYAQAGKLSTMSPDEWADVSGTADTSFNEKLKGIAEGYTTKREKSQAEITEEFAKSMTAGLNKVLDKVGDELIKQLKESGALGKTIASILNKILGRK
jgi:hypothetical protein